MNSRDTMDTDEWLRRLETTIARSRDTAENQEPTVAQAWSNPLQDEAGEDAFRIGGGSLAVGVLNDIPTAKEFINRTITEAERLLAEQGPFARLADATVGDRV